MRSVAAVVALAACLHAGLWAFFQASGHAPGIKRLESVSYAPFEGIRNPEDVPTEAQVRADLKAISGVADAVRTYRSTRGMEVVPRIAAEFGLKVTLGIGLESNLDRNDNYDLVCDPDDPDKCDTRVSRNEAEIKTAIRLAHTYNNVNAIVVGNETTLKRSMVAATEADQAQAAYENPRSHENPDTHQRMTYPDFRSALTDIEREWNNQLQSEAAKRNLAVKNVKAEWNIDELIKVIQRVKRQLGPNSVPVTTGETWDVWDNHRKLGDAVDFIAAHILPYWDMQTSDIAVRYTFEKFFDTLTTDYPGKHIVIAEFGWPSAGFNRGAAEPGRIEQATVLRQFVDGANRLGIDYNIIEAFDQPWKTSEGSVGRYWGIFDASRQAKFILDGAIGNADYWKIAALAVTLGFLISLPILSLAGATARQATLMVFGAHAVGAWSATVVDYWNGHYFVLGAGIALLFGLLLLVPLVLIGLARIKEIAAVLFGPAPIRLLAPAAAPQDYAPKVSIHIPAHMEPPDMLKHTLDAVARLDYPNFECVVVINNTPDPALWQPVEEHCRALGERFKFVNVEQMAGYKAGALRIALAHTAEDAEIIGVIDADYAVEPNWLKDVVPAFADPKVGLVQAPQDHRDETTPLHWAMNGEYAGFFDIGMVQRNEENAIIVHGTMCLMRRSALATAGGWSSDTICEDTDVGLAIIEQGWLTHYTRRRYGRGLLPDTFEAYKKQRHRWAFGGLQIIRKHWRRFLPGESRLSGEQKWEFAIGWLNWLGAESVGVAVAILNLIWVPVVAFAGIAIPDKVLTLPIIAAFAVSVAHFLALYQRRVAISPAQMAAAMVAAMSMQWTVARAVAYGLVTEHLPFVRTAKGGSRRKKRVRFPAFYEALLGGLLLAGAVVVIATNHESVREINIFGAVLIVQSLPFLAATTLAAVEETRFNDFVFWRKTPARLIARFIELLPGRAAAVTAAVPQPAPPPENRIEAAP